MARAGLPALMKSITCWLVATEQLPDTMACSPCAAGRRAASLLGATPKLPGRPMATPEPAVTSGMPLRAGPRRSRSSLDTASTTAMRTPSAAVASMRARMAASPCATTLWSIRPTAAGCLRLQHAHQVGVGHGRERVVLHAALVEQHIAHKQVALEHGALVVGEGGRGDGEVGAQRLHQRIGHRADVAFGRAVKGGAVLEVDLLGALRLQPLQRGQRLGNGFVLGNGARLERDHHGVGLGIERAVGTPMACTTRMPARTRLLARSVAPVKSSAMQPSSARARVMPFSPCLRAGDAGEDLDHGAVVFLAQSLRWRPA
jgi:hypothetical protein